MPVPFSPLTLCLCNSQYIWLTWWTVRTAKLISFWVHGSHGDHLMSASKPIWSKHYSSTADCRVDCLVLVCTCALCTDPITNSENYISNFVDQHLSNPGLENIKIEMVGQEILLLIFSSSFIIPFTTVWHKMKSSSTKPTDADSRVSSLLRLDLGHD